MQIQIKNLNEEEQQELNVVGQYPKSQPKEPSNDVYQEDLIYANIFVGTIEICFLIDTTESMNQNKEFIREAMKQLYENLKSQYDKVIKYAVVTYNDYEEYNQYNLYPQQDFDEDINKILKFIIDLKFQGGNDFAEDLQHGLNQALQLKWQSMNKIIMVLTDAPCHGQKYHQDMNDKFPEGDMVKQLDQIIEQKINLLCIGFKNEHNPTKQMYKEFKKYLSQKDYKKIQRHTVDVNQQFSIKVLKDIIQNINQPQQSTIFQQLDDNLVLKFAFEVFYCDLDIKKLSQYLDSDNQQQQLCINQNSCQFQYKGEFDFCEREGLPFYQDSTKKIFKMIQQRHNGQVDVYAITTSFDGPFKNKLAAASFIKSHLITKVLYNQFKQQLGDFENISFHFSNYILLKEKNENQNDQYENYWIAQRIYQKDQLYQFNDSEGNLTSKENSDQNEIIQSFSFFTYYQSNCKLLICDLKIYKNILLHPKINTHNGQYGQQDNGKNAIYNFLYQFRNFKKQYKYLDYLNIKYN